MKVTIELEKKEVFRLIENHIKTLVETDGKGIHITSGSYGIGFKVEISEPDTVANETEVG